ncbi:hypothetical protein [uncultured Draconibacterium sp.]|uniref:hypothetical protein n=1 Tax=uncultured Draconibacterium sp. TaxID=1573823 RepID=UPI00321791C0
MVFKEGSEFSNGELNLLLRFLRRHNRFNSVDGRITPKLTTEENKHYNSLLEKLNTEEDKIAFFRSHLSSLSRQYMLIRGKTNFNFTTDSYEKECKIWDILGVPKSMALPYFKSKPRIQSSKERMRFMGGRRRYHENLSKVRPTGEYEIIVEPGAAPMKEISDLLYEISKLYEMTGGSGIVFEIDEIKAPNYVFENA